MNQGGLADAHGHRAGHLSTPSTWTPTAGHRRQEGGAPRAADHAAVPHVVYKARPHYRGRVTTTATPDAVPVHGDARQTAPLAAKEQSKALRKAKTPPRTRSAQGKGQRPNGSATRSADKRARLARPKTGLRNAGGFCRGRFRGLPRAEGAAVGGRPPRARRHLPRGPQPAPKKRKKGAEFFGHPLPARPAPGRVAALRAAPNLLPALLDGTACGTLRVVQGPPGTGKTRALVTPRQRTCPDASSSARPPTSARPTCTRCVAGGLGDRCALALAPRRVPVGTVVQGATTRRARTCAPPCPTAGPFLHGQPFTDVCVDQTAQCPGRGCGRCSGASQLARARRRRQAAAGPGVQSGKALKHGGP